MKLSFNHWLLTLNHGGAAAQLATKWQARKGRLTRASVEARAVALGFHAGLGAAAWDAYQGAVLHQVPAATPPEATQPSSNDHTGE